MEQFNKLYKEHYKMVYRLAFRFTNNNENAADISQDVFMYLFKTLSRKGEIKNERAWLYTVTSNLCLAFIRKNKRIITLKDENKNGIEEHGESTSEIMHALQKMNEKDRILLILYNEGLTYNELSEATGIKFTSVGKTLSRALEKLKDEVEKRK